MAIGSDLSGNSVIGYATEPTVKRGTVVLPDGVTAPATKTGIAQTYVDAADGDYKIKFGDGVVKVIAADS